MNANNNLNNSSHQRSSSHGQDALSKMHPALLADQAAKEENLSAFRFSSAVNKEIRTTSLIAGMKQFSNSDVVLDEPKANLTEQMRFNFDYWSFANNPASKTNL